jgi:hypothetical protein
VRHIVIERIVIPAVYKTTRFVTTYLLAVALLAPFLCAFVPSLQKQEPSCGMSCCKKAKQCGHHSDHNESTADPHWTSGRTCPLGCGQHPGLLGSHTATLAGDRIELGVAPTNSAFRDHWRPSRGRSWAEFALFERPPPPHSPQSAIAVNWKEKKSETTRNLRNIHLLRGRSRTDCFSAGID